MTDETDTPTAAAAPDQAAAAAPQIRVIAQYIKDLSFENPDPMNALRAGQPAPSIDVGIDVQARKAQGDGSFEVDLNITVRAKREDTVAFICELKYAGLFQFVNVPPEAVEPLLLVEAPRMLFPFARRIVAEATRDGGFPPLYIDPIDFMGLYQKQRASSQSAPAAGEAGGETPGDASPAGSA
ncbi:MAG: protein-export chaperone SecB [Maricaulaceae bacterium]|jgi:preprotein translocase subunit SecB